MTTFIRLTLITSFITLTACAGLSKDNTNASALITSPESTPEAVKVRDFNLEKDTLYDLIVAEVAAVTAHKNIHVALAVAQSEMGPLIKGAMNPHFKKATPTLVLSLLRRARH